MNSDRQMADGLTKPQAAWKLLEIVSAEKWKIAWDATSRVQESSSGRTGLKAKEIF